MASKSGVSLVNSGSCRLRFACTFLRSLSKIKAQRPIIVSPSAAELRRRSRRIKLAAYSSMARAVGPRKAWARALLFKLQTRARHRTLMRHRSAAATPHKPRSTAVFRASSGNVDSTQSNQVRMLRRLLPGGDAMDVCTLLEETAHYIHCLSTQVKVMKAISHQLSSN